MDQLLPLLFTHESILRNSGPVLLMIIILITMFLYYVFSCNSPLGDYIILLLLSVLHSII